jgi:septin 6/8/11
VNIIPIIAKADTISKSELHKFKIKIMGELVSNGVQIYQFPTDDEAVAEINAVMNVSVEQGPQGSQARWLTAITCLRHSPKRPWFPEFLP